MPLRSRNEAQGQRRRGTDLQAERRHDQKIHRELARKKQKLERGMRLKFDQKKRELERAMRRELDQEKRQLQQAMQRELSNFESVLRRRASR